MACTRRGQRSVDSTSGALYWEYETSDGIPDGRSRTFHPNGSLRTEGYFLRAMKHGAFLAYDRSGRVIKKAFFWHDVLVWTSHSADNEPPEKLLLALRELSDPAEIRRLFGGAKLFADDEPFIAFNLGPPVGAFVSGDRHVRTGNRLEIQLGAGGNTASPTAARHLSIFGQLQHGEFGAFIQFDGSSVKNTVGMPATAQGRQTMEGGATHELWSGYGRLSSRFSLVAPLRNNDADGLLAAAATSYQHPSHAILSQPSSVALRGSSSWVLQGHRWVVQTDVGIDTALGGAPGRLPVIGRLNTSLGLGIRSAVAIVEFSSAADFNDFDQRLLSLGAGTSVYGGGVAVKWLIARTSERFWTFSVGSEYAF